MHDNGTFMDHTQYEKQDNTIVARGLTKNHIGHRLYVSPYSRQEGGVDGVIQEVRYDPIEKQTLLTLTVKVALEDDQIVEVNG